MGKITLSLCVLGVLVGFAPTAWGGYTGSLSTADGGLDGTGDWISGTSTIEWSVTQNGDQSWHYEYTLTVPGEASGISHFILETSEPLPEGDIWDIQGDYGEAFVGEWFYPGSGNPDMPDDLYGTKFDDAWGTTFTVEFTSNRLPVWGDFYAVDGQAGGGGLNQFWNSGFLLDDPLFPPSDGSLDGHILRPDSRIPEPSTVAMLALGLMTLGAAVRRRRETD